MIKNHRRSDAGQTTLSAAQQCPLAVPRNLKKELQETELVSGGVGAGEQENETCVLMDDNHICDSSQETLEHL